VTLPPGYFVRSITAFFAAVFKASNSSYSASILAFSILYRKGWEKEKKVRMCIYESNLIVRVLLYFVGVMRGDRFDLI